MLAGLWNSSIYGISCSKVSNCSVTSISNAYSESKALRFGDGVTWHISRYMRYRTRWEYFHAFLLLQSVLAFWNNPRCQVLLWLCLPTLQYYRLGARLRLPDQYQKLRPSSTSQIASDAYTWSFSISKHLKIRVEDCSILVELWRMIIPHLHHSWKKGLMLCNSYSQLSTSNESNQDGTLNMRSLKVGL